MTSPARFSPGRILCFVIAAGAPLLSAAEPESDGKSAAELVPSESIPSLNVAADLQVETVLSDPRIANPLYLNFDERGRLWVVEYRQYPHPAGLKLLNDDALRRNVYDPPFAPPPPHAADSPFRGKDRITIHEDTDADGQYDKHVTFLDGLNLCTAALPGRGGVFVLNPPYLLFYADKNRDDVPDDPQPKVLLSGFGIEDSHSIANSLRWGPDGWIYAAHGSTVTARVIVHDENGEPRTDVAPVERAGQFIWRYHPTTGTFEVFAEGGGNAFGVEFDDAGRLFSGHNGGNTRGFHYVQGGFYLKNFGKHGALSNPHAFGYLPAMKHAPVERFTHTFEIYEGTTLPERYQGTMIALAPHLHYVMQTEVLPNGSTVQTRDIGKVLTPGDGTRADWFSPVDIQTGPDGCLYVADWFSRNVKHFESHDGETDPELGRILRLLPKSGFEPDQRFDLAKWSAKDLVTKGLSHPNRWHRETALRLLYDQPDPSVSAILEEHMLRPDNRFAHWALWGLNATGGLTEERLEAALRHESATVRTWAVRLTEQHPRLRDKVDISVLHLAEVETDPRVLVQVLASARRVSPGWNLTLVSAMAWQLKSVNDPFLPLMSWWATNAHDDDPLNLLGSLQNAGTLRKPLALAGEWHSRLVRRFAGTDDAIHQRALWDLFDFSFQTLSGSDIAPLLSVLEETTRGRKLTSAPDSIRDSLRRRGDVNSRTLLLRMGDAVTQEKIAAGIANPDQLKSVRVEHIAALVEGHETPEQLVTSLRAALHSSSDLAKQAAVMRALSAIGTDAAADAIVERISTLNSKSKSIAISLLSARIAWQPRLIELINEGSVAGDSLSIDVHRRLLFSPDATVASNAKQLLPPLPVTPKNVGKRINELAALVNAKPGDPQRGRDIYMRAASCGKCHRLAGEGGQIGPDLTPYNRHDTRGMLFSILDPSAEIREGYEAISLVTDDGQLRTGLLLSETPGALTLRDAEGKDHVVQTAEIEERTTQKRSLMPVGLLDRLTEQELRDLFAWLNRAKVPAANSELE